jgi:hypothetical protein
MTPVALFVVRRSWCVTTRNRRTIMATNRHPEPTTGHEPVPTQPSGPVTDVDPAPHADFVLVIRDGRPLPVRTRLAGGPQDGRTDSWFTLAPEDLPAGWVFPRRVQTAEGEVLVGDFYQMRLGQVPAHGIEVVYDYEYTGLTDMERPRSLFGPLDIRAGQDRG